MATATPQLKTRFTLIELLVVVAIIAILASLLLPALSRARDKARATTCINNQKQINMGIFLYADANDDHLPWSRPSNGQHWDGAIREVANQPSSGPGTIFYCPSAFSGGHNHYGAHPALMPNQGRNDAQSGKALTPYRIGNIPRAEEIVTTFDAPQMMFDGAWPSKGGADPESYGMNDNIIFWWTFTEYLSWLGPDEAYRDNGYNRDVTGWGDAARGKIRFRHEVQSSGTFGFADGHAAIIRQGKLLQRNVMLVH